MKIVHLCLASFYIDNYSYQENLLPKYHKLAGHDVTIIASLVSFSDKGKPILLDREAEYNTAEGCKVYRMDYRHPFYVINRRFRKYTKLESLLNKETPDLIFIHGVQFADILSVIKYKEKNPKTRLLCDNHADWINSARGFLSKNILHKVIWKYYAKKAEPYIDKFYGVTPVRCEFLSKMYGISASKIELLVMGVDDKIIPSQLERNHIKKRIKKELHLNDNDFLIITGGKIDSNKNIHILADVLVKYQNIHLIIFGNVLPEMKEMMDKYFKKANIHYVGWLDSRQTTEYFIASDLAFFPGTHSVLWEQAVGIGIPAVFKHWEGMEHVDVGGNCRFLYENTHEEIETVIEKLISNNEEYSEMKKLAEMNALKFYYSDIANRVL